MYQATDPHLRVPMDPDLSEQARPGHGVPSQDPDLRAQYPIGRDRAIEERKTVFTGAGAVAGMAAGAAVGVALSGPVGALLGGTAGAILGALGGAVAGSLSRNGDVRGATRAHVLIAPPPGGRSRH